MFPINTPHGYFADPASINSECMIQLRPGTPIVHCYHCTDGTRDMILTKPVAYVDPCGDATVVPTDFRFNGLSNPIRTLWGLCDPYEPMTRDASVPHDWDCVFGTEWKKAAWRFYHAMIAAFIHSGKYTKRWDIVKNTVKAWFRWAAVRYIGIWFQKRYRS